MVLDRCPWYVAGPLIGLILVVFRAALNKPFGALGGYIDVVEQRGLLSRLGVNAYILFGTIIGGAIFALVSGGVDASAAYAGMLPAQPALAAGVLILAGGVMGFGARTAGGCTSGHGLTGMSLASPASIAAAVTFFATAVALANLVAWLIGVSS
jgi:uncharacterized membrane protein YedE/YeeE